MQLSEEQSAAAKHTYGPALCIAGPGSGKTAVIINRVNNLILQGVKPAEILVVTFAKAAAKSMESRFFEMTGVTGVRFSTIHSLCYHIINLSGENKLSLIPDKLKKRILLKSLSETVSFGISGENQYRDLCMEISRFKSRLEASGIIKKPEELSFADDYETHFTDKKHFKIIYAGYKRFLEQNNYYDFDDMTFLARRYISCEPHIKRTLGYKYLMADEFQDTSLSQLKLLKELSCNENVFVVGDDDQSIYSFRGASPDIFNIFKNLFPDYRLFILKNNYRCNNLITAAANSLIRENKSRFPKEIISKYSSEDKNAGVSLKRYKTGFDELKGIHSFISSEEYIDKKNFAVLTRTNYEAELVCSFFRHKGLSFDSALSDGNPFNHPYINIILSFMRLGVNKADLQDYVNAFKLSDFPISAQIISACLGRDTKETFDKLVSYSYFDEFMKNKFNIMYSEIKILQKMTPALQTVFIRKTCGLDMFLKNECIKTGAQYELEKERIENFFEFVKGFSNSDSLLCFINNLESPVTEKNKTKLKGRNKLSIMTLHASKGLEFDYVWIINVNEGIIPFRKAVEKGMTEEERRLFYVGMTRAKDRLILSCHNSTGNKKIYESPFLKNLTLFSKVEKP